MNIYEGKDPRICNQACGEHTHMLPASLKAPVKNSGRLLRIVCSLPLCTLTASLSDKEDREK